MVLSLRQNTKEAKNKEAQDTAQVEHNDLNRGGSNVAIRTTIKRKALELFYQSNIEFLNQFEESKSKE